MFSPSPILFCLQSIQKQLPQILQYSGKYFDDLGQYYQCLESKGMLYNYLTFGLPQSTIDLGTQIGLCLPKECNQETVKMGVDSVLEQLKLPFVVKTINNNVPAYHYDFDWTFFLTIIIFFSVIGLLTASTFFTKYKPISMFSIQESSKTFKRNPNSNLNVLNGVRSLSMIWVVLGHAMSYTISGSINISSSIETNSLTKPFFLIVEGGLFAVDIFFFVAGILLAYGFLKMDNISLATYPMALLQRVLRFWPSYFFAILIFYSVYLHLGDGPRWGSDQETVEYCAQIWKPLLFVDNLIDNGEYQCMGWGWYLQNDMQLFVGSLFILFLYGVKPIISKLLIIVSMIGSVIFTYNWTYNHGITVISHLIDFAKWGDFMLNVYMKPWARCTPYLWGLLIGIFYVEYLQKMKKKKDSPSHQTKNNINQTFLGKLEVKFKQNKKLRILVEWIGITVMIFLMVIIRTLQVGTQWPQYAHSLYQSLAKLIFVMALSLTILPSLLGCKDSVINFTMDTRLFNFIAKVSFCTYLIHLTILQIWVQSRIYSRYYTTLPAFVEFGGVLVLSISAGLVMTFLIELPFSKLQKQLINRVKRGLIGSSKEKSLGTQKSQLHQATSETIEMNKSLLTEA